MRRSSYRDRLPKYQKNDFRHFGSVREFLDAVEPVASLQKHDSAWAGGTYDDAVRFCRLGDVASVGDASKYADMINDAVDLAGVRQEWTPDVVGAFPSVPAFLAGDPCSMWARSPVHDERGEIDVYIDLAASVKASAENMRRRGVCVLALLLALQRVRNVRAHFYTAHVGGNFTMDFSYPFDVSELAAFCGRPVVIRQLTYSFCEEIAKQYKQHTPLVLFGAVYPAAWSECVTGDRSGEIAALERFAGVPRGSLVITQGQLGDLSGLSDDAFVKQINDTINAVNGGNN